MTDHRAFLAAAPAFTVLHRRPQGKTRRLNLLRA
jgi:hypothetical protein